ncbi:hypothetical protein MtrunA17_Chr1g0154721 [Medicago truncatula]|uniref:Uncharacterized protein n=1 Tax=Medicago truncatula TaxID=3880 RepID=A0A396JMD7_MEDTR|nr:hypothetical protein MtrunA17_Chr1g0154721 [Medicago truncatula]
MKLQPWCHQACHHSSEIQHLVQQLKKESACLYPVPVDVPMQLSSEL